MSSEPDRTLTGMLHTMMPLVAHLDIEGVSGDAESVVTRAAWAEEHCTAGGVLHGGYLMAMADTTGATLAVFNLPEGALTSTIESKTNFLRAATDGEITVTSTPVHTGRRTIVIQTDITRADGKLVTRTTQTQAVL